ncbi:GH92 family glycosyl hydrolase [candidate division KSB1 bacterium]|nr:GH92 family glycosyl hydrolase [candidate division KSB1 bacterium]
MRNPKIFGLLIITCCLSIYQFSFPEEKRMTPIDFVNPFICTRGDHGQLYPGATCPFGTVKLSPDTYPDGLNGRAHAGYDDADSRILGFSHVRVGGMGCSGEGGNILLLPFVGEKDTDPDKYHQAFIKSSEIASPGYYCVRFANGIRAELTVTEHAGLHKYSFPKSPEAHILIDLGRGFTKVVDTEIHIESSDALRGVITAKHNCSRIDEYTLYFYIKLSRPFESFETWNGDAKFRNMSHQRGAKIGAFLTYSTGLDDIILVKIGISAISSDQAKLDLEAEIADWDFDAVHASARLKWSRLLNRVDVEGNSEYKQIFYTALYHSYTMPMNTTSPVNRQYRGTDGNLHRAIDYVHYDCYSMWDTFRSKYPLVALLEPAVMNDISRSLVDYYDQGMSQFPFLMIRREHTGTVLLDSYRKQIRNFDIRAAFEGMQQDALEQLPPDLEKLGYVPKRPDRTLEYAYDDWCVAWLANELGEANIAQRFFKRAQFYKNIWNDSLGFFRAKDDQGNWLPFPDPAVIDETYVYEASMWQWRWFVLHDIQGLIDLMGGREKFVQTLNYFFENDLYNHGNQPDLQAAYLFDFAGAPWLSQKWVRKILTEPMMQRYGTHGFFDEPIFDRIYKAEPAGYLLEMDDDCGTMAAWYVLSAMGFYPVCVGEPVYEIGTPIFDKITIHLDDEYYSGNDFVIEARNVSQENIYIQSATLNGKRYNKPWLHHDEIVSGGRLVFEMGAEPNTNWGSLPDAVPPSMGQGR